MACALVGDPELLFLDEPTTGLDPQSRLQLWDIVESFKRDGRTVVLTTHYMDEAERLCDRVGIIDHGKAIALGTPRELIASLGAPEVIELTIAQRGEAPLDEDAVRALPGVRALRKVGSGLALSVEPLHVALPAVVSSSAPRSPSSSWKRLAATRHATLEDVFVALTGRGLRD